MADFFEGLPIITEPNIGFNHWTFNTDFIFCRIIFFINDILIIYMLNYITKAYLLLYHKTDRYRLYL